MMAALESSNFAGFLEGREQTVAPCHAPPLLRPEGQKHGAGGKVEEDAARK